ncbi:hypothetical protein HUN01_02540 (plasmid) [Nostoc edaphicum CCNP1411]|uniref:Uncharacterized protein n=1 Tax=Nostoc edaphicum CCNP1411 TaxID=1472755 RepID=A0A7D7Q934_9NOSO|nr:hypothetical protein [Nostoc edaphicum]QMS86497.1 hypothetical protein HUN01_02540 [Nostoc edaphicum CCNP1411]
MFTSCIITSAASKPGCSLSQQPPTALPARRMIDMVWQNPQPLQQRIHRRVTASHFMQLP